MQDDTQTLFDIAHQLQSHAKWQEALAAYQQILTQSPHDLDVLRRIGWIQAKQRNTSAAIETFQQALVLAPNDAHLHNHIANVYKAAQQQDLALQHYRQAIALEPDYAPAYDNLGTLFAANGDTERALQCYRDAIHQAPDYTPAHYHLGLLFLKQQQLDYANIQFRNVINLDETHQDALFYLGIIALHQQALSEADAYFHRVLDIAPEHCDALVNLGVVALKQNKPEDALLWFAKSLSFNEHHVEARNNLAATYMHHDRYENALKHYQILLQQDPHNMEYLYNAGVAQMILGHLDEAKAHFEDMLNQDNQHFAALNNLAAIYSRLNQRNKALTLLRQAHLANPHDASCQFMLQAMEGSQTQTTSCQEYVQNLFNNYALHYDDHLKNQLQYTLPYQMVHILHQFGIVHADRILDLGCGTGLSGMVLQDMGQHLTGVDLSPKMLDIARSKEIYHTLVTDDIVHFLQQESGSYDLIIAADVMPYLGDLSIIWQLVTQTLSKNGYFIFSTEISENRDWTLQQSARFCHHPAYIQTLCQKICSLENATLQLIHQEKIVARQQNNQDLHVMVYLLQKHHASF